MANCACADAFRQIMIKHDRKPTQNGRGQL
jgi:hypothetical protein